MISANTLAHLETMYHAVEDEYNQRIRHHVQQQMEGNLSDVRALLVKAAQLCENRRPARLYDWLDDIANRQVAISQLAKALDENFMLFIMGSGKNGKSTLLNAIVGQEAAAEDMIPKIWKIDIFKEGKRSDAVVVTYNTGEKKKLSYEQAVSLLNEEEQKRAFSLQKVNAQLKDFRKTKPRPSPQAMEEKKRQLEKYELYRSPITEVEWSIVGSPILSNYRLVDTPGLKQEIDNMTIASAKEYYTKADGVIWILRGDKLASSADRDEIEALRKSYGDRDNIIAVINHMDVVLANGGTVEQTLAEANKLYGDMFSEFITISARQARDGQHLAIEGETPDEKNQGNRLIEKSNITALMTKLNRSLFSNSLQLQLHSKLASTQAIYGEINSQAQDAITVLTKMDAERLEKKNQWHKARVDIVARLQGELESFKNEEASRIRGLTAEREDFLWDMESAPRNQYILEKIIMPKRIEQRLEGMIDRHSKQLEETTTYHLKQAPFQEFPLLKEQCLTVCVGRGGSLGNANIEGDLSDEVGGQMVLGGALAFGAAALLGPIGVLLAGFAVTDMGRSIAKWLSRTFGSSMADKVTTRFNGQMDEIIKKMTSEYEAYLEKSDTAIDKMREQTYAQLYGSSDKTEELLTVFRTIQKACKPEMKRLTVGNLIFSQGEE